MSITVGDWQEVAIALNGTTSGEVDLGNGCDFVNIIVPTIDSGTVNLQVAMRNGGTYYTLGSSVTTATGTGNYADIFNLGGFQYLKIVCSATQTAARTFYVRGRKS